MDFLLTSILVYGSVVIVFVLGVLVCVLRVFRDYGAGTCVGERRRVRRLREMRRRRAGGKRVFRVGSRVSPRRPRRGCGARSGHVCAVVRYPRMNPWASGYNCQIKVILHNLDMFYRTFPFGAWGNTLVLLGVQDMLYVLYGLTRTLPRKHKTLVFPYSRSTVRCRDIITTPTPDYQAIIHGVSIKHHAVLHPAWICEECNEDITASARKRGGAGDQSR